MNADDINGKREKEKIGRPFRNQIFIEGSPLG